MVIEEMEVKKAKNKPNFITALRSLFSSDEKEEKNVEKEVEELKALSSKNIENLENKFFTNKKKSKKDMTDNLKVNSTIADIEAIKKTSGKKEKEEEKDEMIK